MKVDNLDFDAEILYSTTRGRDADNYELMKAMGEVL